LEEMGIEPYVEYGHTLKVPLSNSEGGPKGLLCFTRVSQRKWVYRVERYDTSEDCGQEDLATDKAADSLEVGS
jgi:hypothetical protein